MASHSEQPMVIDAFPSDRSDSPFEAAMQTSGAGGDAGSASTVGTRLERSEASSATSIALFYALAAVRPDYLAGRLDDNESSLNIMRETHTRYAGDAEVADDMKLQSHRSTPQEIEATRKKYLKRQAESIRLREAECAAMQTERQQLEAQLDTRLRARGDQQTAAPQLPALRLALRSHFSPSSDADTAASALSFEQHLSDHVQLLKLQSMARKAHVRITQWSAAPNMGQSERNHRAARVEKLNWLTHQLTNRDLSPSDLREAISRFASSLPLLELRSSPDPSMNRRLHVVRNNLYVKVLLPFRQYLHSLPSSTRTPDHVGRQLIHRAGYVTSLVVFVEASGSEANRLKMEKDMFIVGNDIETTLACLKVGSNVNPHALMFRQLPESMVDYMQRWEVHGFHHDHRNK